MGETVDSVVDEGNKMTASAAVFLGILFLIGEAYGIYGLVQIMKSHRLRPAYLATIASGLVIDGFVIWTIARAIL